MINNLIQYVIGVLMFACLLSCSQKEVYYEFASIPQNKWSVSNEICFVVDSIYINPSSGYDINVEITHSVAYPYKTLWLYLDQTIQDTIFIRDTLECLLTDEVGKWRGSGNGSIRQISFEYKKGISIDTAKHNQICISHAMQDFLLKGIERVGLKIY